MSDVRVRFAPSPTGELHIGGARTALFNYLFARRVGGTFVLRIDDTDLERSREDFIDKLMSAMKWLGLDWDEGPYYQSQRLDLYRSEAEKLIEEGKAYRCYCSIEELRAGREQARKENRAYLYPGNCRNLDAGQEQAFQAEGRKPVVRIRIPDQGQTVVTDLVRGKVSFENSDLDDFIIVKSNGIPTYNFASVVDDLQLKITHIIRAEEHLSNTPRQIICAEALGLEMPVFAHVPMILAPDRSKLSKRHGATSVEEFRDKGYLPEALVNYMTLLGWSPGGDRELFSLEESIKSFELEKVNKTAAIYDTTKLTWMNSHYIRDAGIKRLTNFARPFFEKENLIGSSLSENDEAYLREVLEAVRERARTLPELADAAAYFYLEDFAYDEKGIKKAFLKENVQETLKRLSDELKCLEPFSAETAEKLFQDLSEEMQLSAGKLIQPARLALTGRLGGPGLFVIIELLGRDKTVERLERARLFIKNHTSTE